MSFIVKITAAARTDTLNAFFYYESIRIGLGESFLTELEKKYSSISINPKANSFIDNKYIKEM